MTISEAKSCFLKGGIMRAILFLSTVLFSLSIQAQVPSAKDRAQEMIETFYSVQAVTLEELPVDEATLKHYQAGNKHLACQDDLGSAGLIFDKSRGILGPIKEEVETAKEIVDEAGKVVDGIINIGKKIWEIIEAGKPVSNLNMEASANALPQGVKCWNELSNWKAPAVRTFSQGFVNGFGSEVIRFDFDVIYTYGGDLNGVGQYLTNVQVHPKNVSVAWGFSLDAAVEIPSLVNLGSNTDPVAGMQIDVKWKASSYFKEITQSASVFVQGDGPSKTLR